MKILGIIPARGGSKTIPRKNIKFLGGEPLIGYTIRSAKASNLISKVVVSTDDCEIAMVAKDYEADVPFIRASELAMDHTPTIEVVLDALKKLKVMGEVFDAVVLLEPTYPFRKEGEIDECITLFKESKADSLISVIEVPPQFNPHWVFEVDQNNYLEKAMPGKLISRRQILPKAYARDGSIYITKTDVLLKKACLYGKHIAYKVNTLQDSVNIDTIADWQRAEQLVEKYSLSTIL